MPEREAYETNTLRELASTAFAACGLDWQEHISVDDSLLRPNDILVSQGNPLKAAEKLGWKPHYFMRDVVGFMVEAKRK